MKKILLSGIALFSIALSQAQTAETLSTGNGYVNSSFYSLENGEISNVSNTDWELSFSTSIYSTYIRINGGHGVELYTYPNGDTSDWATVDISGISGWNSLYNSDENWDSGAFNASATGHPNYGWGNYNNITHSVTGDSIFIVKTLNGTYKKLLIESFEGGNWNFKYANIDGSSLVTESVSMANYTDKNYVYYSLDNATTIDREPDTGTWDFVVTKYQAWQPQGSYYPSTGILLNKGLKAREARNVDVNVALWGDYSEEEKMNVIGADWKSFNMVTFSYDIEDDLSYFITDRAGNIWQIIMTGFDGSSAGGNVHFTKELISAVSIDENESINVGVYPNPASTQVTFLYDNLSSEEATIKIYDINGRMVYSNQFFGTSFNQHVLDVSSFSKGFYNVIIESNERIGTQKLIIE